jgi:predicted nucleic acid-binding protein
MTRVFADAFYFLALINSKDPYHQPALQFSSSRSSPLLTTSFVLLELADGFARTSYRTAVARIIRRLRRSKTHEVVPFSEELLERALALYDERPYKAWSLTDCSSFVVMWDNGLTDALTGDQHFAQAGFNLLLRLS